jgi:hypothetical protein
MCQTAELPECPDNVAKPPPERPEHLDIQLRGPPGPPLTRRVDFKIYEDKTCIQVDLTSWLYRLPLMSAWTTVGSEHVYRFVVAAHFILSQSDSAWAKR